MTSCFWVVLKWNVKALLQNTSNPHKPGLWPNQFMPWFVLQGLANRQMVTLSPRATPLYKQCLSLSEKTVVRNNNTLCTRLYQSYRVVCKLLLNMKYLNIISLPQASSSNQAPLHQHLQFSMIQKESHPGICVCVCVRVCLPSNYIPFRWLSHSPACRCNQMLPTHHSMWRIAIDPIDRCSVGMSL